MSTAAPPNPYQPPAALAPQVQARPSWLYYGWVIVICAAVAMAATFPGRTHGLGIVTDSLLRDFPQISEQQFAHINLVATLLGALFCLPCGWLIDRLGSRLVVGATIAALGAVVLLMSRVQDAAMLAIAITLTRGIGQSMLSVVSITMVGKWFQRSIGPAMGVYSVVMTMLMAVSYAMIFDRVQQHGWRDAWAGVGWTLLMTSVPITLLAFSAPRDRSREFGAESANALQGATLIEALRTPCFWVFAGSISFFGLVSSGVSLFQQRILAERGFDAAMFRNVMILGLPIGMLANLAAGGLARRIPLQWLLAAGLALVAVALAFLPLITTPAHAYSYAVVYAMGGGIITVMFFAVWGHAFGDLHLGRIQAAAQMMTVFASAVGPEFIAGSRATAQSSAPILWCFAVVAAVLAVIAIAIQVPKAATLKSLAVEE